MIIGFCGHSDTVITKETENMVYDTILNVANKNKVDFYLGGYGSFDHIARCCSKQYKEINQDSKLYFVTPYIDETYLKNRNEFIELFDGTIYPPIERVPKRYAIIERNKWIVKQADVIIAYVNYSFGGAAKMLEYAKKQNKRYINLGDL